VKLKHVVGIAGLAAFVASWIAVGVGYLIHVDKGTWVILVVIAACASEGLFWCIAFMLGVGIVEARTKIWTWLKQPFRNSSRHADPATGGAEVSPPCKKTPF
jgi:hypothetical protein